MISIFRKHAVSLAVMVIFAPAMAFPATARDALMAQAPTRIADGSASGIRGRPARLNVESTTMLTALMTLRRQAGVPLVFSADYLPGGDDVTCSCTEATVGQALDRILAGTGLHYIVLGSQVVIEPVTALPSRIASPDRPMIHPAGLERYSDFADGGAPWSRQGTITGIVVDARTSEPLAGAQVLVIGTNFGTLTNAEGRYRIDGVPVGPAIVRVMLLGYDRATREVTVQESELVVVDFELSPSPIALNEIVVTITGERQKREIATSVASIDVSEVVETAPVTSLSDLLNARASGVSVLQSSGTVGMGSRIRIRGSNSISLSNDPVVYIDGVRVNSAPAALSIYVGGQSPSRINDISAANIESIRIIKGPSATTLYGSDAANGVILITTKRGRAAGDPRFSAFAEMGMVTDRYEGEYPLNYRGKVGTDVASANCFAFMVGLGLCQQQAILTYQPLNDPVVSPISTGIHRQFGMSLSGGGERVTYFLSGNWTREIGTYELPDSTATALSEVGALLPWQDRPSQLRRVNLRANFSSRVTNNLQLLVSTGYTTSRTHFPQNDASQEGILFSGLAGGFTPESGVHGYPFLPPAQAFAIESRQDLDRFTGSVQAKWNPPGVDWLSTNGTVGLDLTSREDVLFMPVGAVTRLGPLEAAGQRRSARILAHAWTAKARATADFDLRPDLTSRTTLGTEYFHDSFHGTEAYGQGLNPGARTISGAANQSVGESTVEEITAGVFVQQQFGWRDRLFVTAGLRADGSSAFGDEFDLATYPKFGVSYVVAEPADDPLLGMINSLRLRAAWGASGVTPGPTDAVRYYSPSVAALVGVGPVPAVTFGSVGNSGLKPERSEEIETGFDAGLLDGRVGLSFTYYRKQTDDALVARQLAPSLGVSLTRLENLGSVLNEGIEASLDVTLLDLTNLRWGFTISGSHNRNELLELGEGIEPIVFSVGTQRHQAGYPLGGFWGKPISFDDANSDGIIVPAEISVADSAQFLGNAFPANALSISTGVTLFDRLQVNALLDYRGDYSKFYITEWFRCRIAICRGLNDADAPLARQAAAVNLAAGAGSIAPYIDDASFWRLRELSLTYFVPDAWASMVGAEALTIVTSARNLMTWTDYIGLDPEVNSLGQNNFAFREVAAQPLPRTWNLRLNVTF